MIDDKNKVSLNSARVSACCGGVVVVVVLWWCRCGAAVVVVSLNSATSQRLCRQSRDFIRGTRPEQWLQVRGCKPGAQQSSPTLVQYASRQPLVVRSIEGGQVGRSDNQAEGPATSTGKTRSSSVKDARSPRGVHLPSCSVLHLVSPHAQGPTNCSRPRSKDPKGPDRKPRSPP